jgi:hypothetical protein
MADKRKPKAKPKPKAKAKPTHKAKPKPKAKAHPKHKPPPAKPEPGEKVEHMTDKERLWHARVELRKHPHSSERLRWYLRAKARLGRFDKRMCSYYGVDPNVNEGCKRAICRAYAAGLVPTSTTGGVHAATSYHSQHRAVDIGVRHPGNPKEARKLARFQRREWTRRRRGKIHPVELIGPINNLIVLRGHSTSIPEGSDLEQMHDNHVHEAY